MGRLWFGLVTLLMLIMAPLKNQNVIAVPVFSTDNAQDEYYHQLTEDHVKIMKKAMDESVDPCENFTKYVCGNYLKDAYGIGVYPNIASEDYIEIAFEDSSKLFDAATKARNFYVSCETKKNFKESFEKINSLQDGGMSWPISKTNLSKNNSVWMRVSEDLKLLGKPSTLDIGYGDDGVLEITYGGDFSSPLMTSREIDELTQTMAEFDVDPKMGKKVLNEIKGFIRDRYAVFKSIASQCIHCSPVETYDLRIDMRTLKERFRGINWDRYFEIALQKKICDQEPMRIHHYLKTMPYLELISGSDKRILTNYIVWSLIKELKNIDSDGESCAARTFNKFGPVLPALYTKVMFDHFNRKQFVDIFKRFRDSFEQSKCRYNATYDRDLEPIFQTEIENIKKLDEIFAPEKLNKQFESVETYPDNYLQNIINLAHHKNCHPHEKECVKQINMIVFIFEVASLYNKPFHYLFVDKYFSLWETVIQHALSRGWNFGRFETAKTCAHVQSELYGTSGDAVQSVIIGATLKQTFEDYKKWLMDNEDDEREKIFNKVGLSSKKAFFVNFAQAHCNQEEKYRSTVFQSLLNMDEFSKEFKCPQDSPMNPSLKCKIL